MRPPHNGNAAPGQGGAPEDFRDQTKSSRTPGPDKKQLLHDLAKVRLHLDRRAEENLIVARWRDSLLAQVRRAALTFEAVDVNVDIESLKAEVDELKAVVRYLAWAQRP
jgi:hypothetical protein